MTPPPKTLRDAEQRCAELRAEVRKIEEVAARYRGYLTDPAMANLQRPRLEGLGDALCDLHVAEHQMAKLRAAAVQAKAKKGGRR